MNISRKAKFSRINKAVKYAYGDYYADELKAIKNALGELYSLKNPKITSDEIVIEVIESSFNFKPFFDKKTNKYIAVVYDKNDNIVWSEE